MHHKRFISCFTEQNGTFPMAREAGCTRALKLWVALEHSHCAGLTSEAGRQHPCAAAAQKRVCHANNSNLNSDLFFEKKFLALMVHGCENIIERM